MLEIIVKNLKKNYNTLSIAVEALSDISLEISKGEFLMITGRNGSGKSTLMHLLALLDKPTSGEIFIGGQEVTKLSPKHQMDLRLRQLGYVFQEYALIAEMTALENVMLPMMMFETGKNAKTKAFSILEKVDLKEKANRLPSSLSGGEQQRVAIARSLINDPKIIFADEPTANLDSVASKKVMNIFKHLNKKDNITIVMVTHEPEELVYATRVINLSDGRIA